MSYQYSPLPPGVPAHARTWTYLRDSGGPSQEQSVDQQGDAMLEFCNSSNLDQERNFRDVARSGGSVQGRHEFMSMIELSEDASIRPQVILIWNYARFARDYNDSVFYLATLRKRGIIVHSLTDQIPTDDFAARVMETIINLSNEEKRHQTSRDVKRGLKSLVSKGFAPGKPPRGFMSVKVDIGEKRDGSRRIVSKWEPDPVLSEYVKLAWQLRATGKSYQEITKATKGKLYTSPNSWNAFFKNKSYLGYFGDIPDHHEPLITQELFDAVQKQRESHPSRGGIGYLNHPRRVGNPSIFSGFTYCIECGSMMTHSRGNKKRPWLHYICGKKDRHGAKACKSRRVDAHNAETQILNFVHNQIFTPEYLLEIYEEFIKKLGSPAEIQRQITAEERDLQELEISIRRILRSIEKTGSQSANDLLIKREAEKAQSKYEIERLNMQLASIQIEITPEAMKIIIAGFLEQFDKLQKKGDIRESKAWLLHFIYRIDLGYNRARIFYTFPMTDILNTRTGNITILRGGTSNKKTCYLAGLFV